MDRKFVIASESEAISTIEKQVILSECEESHNFHCSTLEGTLISKGGKKDGTLTQPSPFTKGEGIKNNIILSVSGVQKTNNRASERKDNKNVKNLFPYSHNALLPKKKAAFTLAEGATHVDMPPSKAKLAFTLAEVLVTLGIIGIVAALTIPTLITKYKVMVLKNQFKTMNSTIQQALLNSSSEMGGLLSEYYVPWNVSYDVVKPACESLKEQIPELNNAWEKQFSGMTKMSNRDVVDVTHNRCSSLVNDSVNLGPWRCYGTSGIYILADGSSVSPLSFSWFGYTNPCSVSFLFDTNGPAQGPNRMGYDVFIYQSYEYTSNSLCNPNVNHSENQYGCYSYARRDKNPIYGSRSYWDILYKPASYWKQSYPK